MSKRALGFMNKSQPITYNTWIGGVSATISTASILATKLGISVGRIENFTIVGSDIKCKITGSYQMPINCWNGNTSITYYTDSDGLVTYLNDSCFYGTTNIQTLTFVNATNTGVNIIYNSGVKELYLSNCTTIDSNSLQYAANLKIVHIPICTSLGVTSGNNGVFAGITIGIKIYAHPSLATNNGGSPDGDLTSQNAAYVTNFTAPSAITDLSVGTIYNTAIQLNFTPPSSTNSIDFYECYANGVFKNIITGSGQYITGLTASTSNSITVKSVDIFLNKSVVSNTVNQTTTNRVATDADAIAYITASSNTVYQDIIDDLFVSLKSNSLYTKIPAFYTFLGTTATQVKWNAKNPIDTDGANRLVFTGSPTFSNNGYLVGGGHANTFLIPNSVQNVNSNGLTVVIGTNNVANTNDTVIGAFGSGSNASWIVVKGNNTNYLRESRINFAAVQQTGTNEAKGIWTGTRQSATVSKLFRNSTLIGSVAATGALPTFPIWIGDLNNNGSPYGSTSQRIQFTAIHEGLSDAEVATLHTIINIFEIAIGRKTW